jgi:hypothetical protein
VVDESRLQPLWTHAAATLPGMNADHLAVALPVEEVNAILERNEK